MKLSVETIDRLLASGRGYAQAAVGFVGMLGVMSAAQQKTVTEALGDVVAGVSQTLHGLTSIWQVLVVVGAPIISVVLARWSSNTAKTDNQAAQAAAAVKQDPSNVSTAAKASLIDATATLPEVKDAQPVIKVSDRALALAVPAENVVASH